MSEKEMNIRLRKWRERADLTRAEMAKMVNLSRSGIRYKLACDEERIRRWEAGEVAWPREPYRLALTEVTHLDPEDLGFIPTRRTRATGNASIAGDIMAHAPLAVTRTGLVEDDKDVRRREFVGLTGAALFSAVLGQPVQGGDLGIEKIAAVIVDYSPPADRSIDLGTLVQTVATAKRNYQACRYTEVIAKLPALLSKLRNACAFLDGDDRLRAQALSAEAYHVTASILLKQEDKGLAWLAADRSVQAAHASQSPLMIGSSSRIITHALMDGGHHHAATDAARGAAERMAADLSTPSPEDLSIYGSLLLRGAIAAADTGSRHNTTELLDEAAQAGIRLGHDGNHMWTAFGPNNVLCHWVNVALRFGDAGTAIDYARQVELDRLPINERKATLLLDTSRAFLMWNHHDKALNILRAAGEIAPEEITGRPTALRLVRDILATAPISVRREAREYAATLGVIA
ncbi:helix-turn-helix transcriptional regulator [Nonomuraea sp. MG754425]|uniref:helix-turn-helix transcriptional regulator n=1 Tax=Nonomuraea sp. MG754425 TaxID=2570319 RepID=UPI001F278EE7|nr:helix-turn-helix transcriptional regulator [Nonomuraea sp. MG754425]